jgi:farnesyl-diphosphate farnesyltransferase
MDIQTLLKGTSRSLYLSVQALPQKMKSAFAIAYLLCRYADTIADTDLMPSDRRIHWITRFPSLVKEQNPAEEKQLASEISGKTENPYEAELVRQLFPCLEVFNSLPDSQKPFILEVVQAVCEGMKLDLSFFQPNKKTALKAFETEEQLKYYCRLMGGKPGRFWSQLIYHTSAIQATEDDFYKLGEQIGDSLQIVNILRDLPKDLQNGRCYFPQTDLAAAGLTVYDLVKKENSPRFEPVKQKWITWGKENLRNGKTYYALLPKTEPRIRTSVAWPILWTADNFVKLSQEKNLLDVSKRVKIPRSTIYKTMFTTPLLLISNRLFNYWLDHKLNKLA